MLDPHREYRPSQLHRETGVPVNEIRLAVQSEELLAVTWLGRDGRVYSRIIGRDFLEWRERKRNRPIATRAKVLPEPTWSTIDFSTLKFTD